MVQVQQIAGPGLELRTAQIAREDLNENRNPGDNGPLAIDIYKGLSGPGQADNADNFVLGGDGPLPSLANLGLPPNVPALGNLTAPGSIVIDFNRNENDTIRFIDGLDNAQRIVQDLPPNFFPLNQFYQLFGPDAEAGRNLLQNTYNISATDLDSNNDGFISGALIINPNINPDGTRTITGFFLNTFADELREVLRISPGNGPDQNPENPQPSPREINFNDAQNLGGYFRDPLTGVTFSNNTLGIVSFQEGGDGNFIDHLSNSTDRLRGRAITYDQGGSIIMNVPGGFSGPLTFDYSSPFFNHEVIIYSNPNGNGTPLANITLDRRFDTQATPGAYGLTSSRQINFSGVAQSVRFGSAPDKLVLDNIRLGSIGSINEPVPVGGGIFQSFPPG
ncbi:hypothetical protein ACP6PL_29170 [Dapis sp. BLCC M126]|uniref:hypothetical protein n=1 Tax=Dapis sp. BLCC M126 TaxID=3400189 RepID=UPI003CF0B030